LADAGFEMAETRAHFQFFDVLRAAAAGRVAGTAIAGQA
jgi:hypothetical protein